MADVIPNAERSERTRRALLESARELFTKQGYLHTTVQQLIDHAGVSRGALYHHYQDKRALFIAVYEEERAALVQKTAIDMQAHIDIGAGDDLFQRTVAAVHAIVENAVSPSVQRIMHIDAPVVLGRTAIQQSGPGLEALRQLMAALMDEGQFEPLPLDPLVHLFWAILFESHRYIARTDDTSTAQEEMRTMLLCVCNGLRQRPSGGERR